MGPFGGYLTIDNCALTLTDIGKFFAKPTKVRRVSYRERSAGIQKANNYHYLRMNYS